jgi:hypothetical protein
MSDLPSNIQEKRYKKIRNLQKIQIAKNGFDIQRYS